MTTDPQPPAPAHDEPSAAVPKAAAAAATAAPVENGVEGTGAPTGDVAALETDVAQLSLNQQQPPQPQGELHRASMEGRIEDVRAVLARGLDQLETLGKSLSMPRAPGFVSGSGSRTCSRVFFCCCTDDTDAATGCTPIVLAVTHGHTDVVRELLAAGAIVPPPGLTMDPTMLAILYPQAMYGAPPPFAQMGPPHFFQPGFYPGAPAPYVPRKDSAANGAAANGVPANANLPPAEVAKTIPCRNFPNCKYGAACMFFHPAQMPGFFPGAPGYAPYEGGFMPYAPNGAPFYPGAQEFIPSANGEPTAQPEQQNGQEGQQPQPQDSSNSTPHPPSAHTPAFVPGGMQVPGMLPEEGANGAPQYLGSPPQGYMSPPMMASQGPPMSNDPAFYATSPPQFQPFMPNGVFPGHPRRQSFGQFNGPKFGHGKKPSFSGGPKPWGPGGRAGASHLGQWKDGHPPPCAFFREGKCRNGEFCKFPHLDAEGNDVRHPDVIRGIIPPAPTRPRVMRMMQGHYDPSRHHMFQAKAAQATAVNGDASPVEGGELSPAEGSDKDAPLSASATLPPKPSSVPTSRSASQPGASRHTRPNSPGARRGAPRAFVNGHAARSSSNGAEARKNLPPQRIPRADEFPALGLGAAITPPERREPSWGKTAAQVLKSEPAPKPVKEEEAGSDEDKAVNGTSEEEAKEDKADDNVTMDSDSEQDAVIVSVSTTPNPEVAKAKLAASSSFASVAGTVEATPVTLKA